MDGLKRFDVAEHGGVRMVVVESELLPPDPAVVVIPILRGYPAVRGLNPTIEHDGTAYVLAPRLIASVRRAALRRVGNVSSQADEITRALDILMAGV
jgi:toxin CcdB